MGEVLILFVTNCLGYAATTVEQQLAGGGGSYLRNRPGPDAAKQN
jgi:hypothetical protein